jgi:hypothetical protein
VPEPRTPLVSADGNDCAPGIFGDESFRLPHRRETEARPNVFGGSAAGALGEGGLLIFREESVHVREVQVATGNRHADPRPGAQDDPGWKDRVPSAFPAASLMPTDVLVPRHSMTDFSAVTTKAGAGTRVLRRPAGAETKPEARVASYLIALSQTDTAEQTEWRHALETRRESVDPRSRAGVQAVGSVRGLPPTTDEPAAAERRGHGRT